VGAWGGGGEKSLKEKQRVKYVKISGLPKVKPGPYRRNRYNQKDSTTKNDEQREITRYVSIIATAKSRKSRGPARTTGEKGSEGITTTTKRDCKERLRIKRTLSSWKRGKVQTPTGRVEREKKRRRSMGNFPAQKVNVFVL